MGNPIWQREAKGFKLIYRSDLLLLLYNPALIAGFIFVINDKNVALLCFVSLTTRFVTIFDSQKITSSILSATKEKTPRIGGVFSLVVATRLELVTSGL